MTFSDLSVEATLECTNSYSGSSRTSNCGGGYPEDASKFLLNRGLPLESKYPYINSNNGNTQFLTSTGICTDTNVSKVSGASAYAYYSGLSVNQIKSLLVKYGPLSVGIYAGYNSFSYYSSGVYSACNQYTSYTYAYNINHAVLLYGWDENNNWLIRNQWGTSWGDGGDMKLSSTYDCGLQYYITLVGVEPVVTPTINTTITTSY